MQLDSILRRSLYRSAVKSAQQHTFEPRTDNLSINPWDLRSVSYDAADRGVFSDSRSDRRIVADTATQFHGPTRDDVYSVRPSQSVSSGPVGPVSLDMHAYSPVDNSTLRDAASVANYYTRLLNNPRFIGYLGGADKAKRVAGALASSPIYRSGARDTGLYNPITGNISVGGDQFDAPVATHELGHGLHLASPAYRDRIYAAMRRHGIPYSMLYVSPYFLPRNSRYLTDRLYLNQPSEQAAELQRVRRETSAYPGSGSGGNGDFTHDDYLKLKPYFERSEYFRDKPEAYILDLLNTARLRRGGRSGSVSSRERA